VADKNTLLNQLRIDRGEEYTETPGRSRLPLFVGIGLISGLIIAGLVWWLAFKKEQPPASESTVDTTTLAPRTATDTTSPVPPASSSALDASGYVVARRQATVSAKTTGRVIEVLIEEGQFVEKNQIIARLDDTNTGAVLDLNRAQFAQAQASLDAAKVALDDARRIFTRNEQQFAAKVISAQDFDNAQAAFNNIQSEYSVRLKALEVARTNLSVAQRDQDDTIVRAPFAGVVTVKAAQPGEIVSPISAGGGFTRTGIGTIVDMTSLEVEVDVNENFINRVRPGQQATIRLNAYPDWTIPAQVIAVIPTADRAKATVKVRVAFKERDERVLPEMGARVSFMSEVKS
jgi:RND family efflux transporter MFP subunit